MDCGPASLKCILEGFGLSANYGRLREACQTDVDGTSIDTIEEIAVSLGMDAEQLVLPADHLFLPCTQSLPALAVIQLPNLATHFVVIWRIVGPYAQVMDPAVGRRWLPLRELSQSLYQHQMPVAADDWFEWASTDDFILPLNARLKNLGVAGLRRSEFIQQALTKAHWLPLATLDAAVRMCQSMLTAGAIKRGSEARALVQQLYQNALTKPETLPQQFWTVIADESREAKITETESPEGEALGEEGLCGEEPEAETPEGQNTATENSSHPENNSTTEDAPQLLMTGAVIIRFRGCLQTPPTENLHPHSEQKPEPEQEENPQPSQTPIPDTLASVLTDPPPKPLTRLLSMLREDGVFAPVVIVLAVALAAVGVVFEALLMRGFLDIGRELGLVQQRFAAVSALLIFVFALLLIEIPIVSGLLRMGRQLEIRLRIALMEKVPRLSDRFFHSRPRSDMAERGHSLHSLRQLPLLGEALLQPALGLLLTTAGIIWLDPASALPAILAAFCALALPLGIQWMLAERDMQVRTHEGALGRFYLDAMAGLGALRAHSAQRPLLREHEGMLVEWARSNYRLQMLVVATEGLQLLLGFALAAWLLLDHFARIESTGTVLLLVYWALNLPVQGQAFAEAARQYPQARNRLLRVLEPLSTPEQDHCSPSENEVSDKTVATVATAVPETIATRETVATPETTATPEITAAQETIATPEITATTEQSDEVTEGQSPSKKKCTPSLGMHIVFNNVGVRAAGHDILHGVNLDIPVGSHVAIVGPSGAGKSSLVGALLGWHIPASGALTVDGKALTASHLAMVRRETVWVDPAVQLWNRSLLDNLAYGAEPGTELAFAQVMKDVRLQGLLQQLPEGMQSKLGEGGGSLSGGEGQRVRLARGMLKANPRLVILDEAFRGLERKHREALTQSSRSLWQDATLLSVSHDVEGALDFDHVVVVDDGQIKEQGAPKILAQQKDSRFAALLAADRNTQREVWGEHNWSRLQMSNGKLSKGSVNKGTVNNKGTVSNRGFNNGELAVGQQANSDASPQVTEQEEMPDGKLR